MTRRNIPKRKIALAFTEEEIELLKQKAGKVDRSLKNFCEMKILSSLNK